MVYNVTWLVLGHLLDVENEDKWCTMAKNKLRKRIPWRGADLMGPIAVVTTEPPVAMPLLRPFLHCPHRCRWKAYLSTFSARKEGDCLVWQSYIPQLSKDEKRDTSKSKHNHLYCHLETGKRDTTYCDKVIPSTMCDKVIVFNFPKRKIGTPQRANTSIYTAILAEKTDTTYCHCHSSRKRGTLKCDKIPPNFL